MKISKRFCKLKLDDVIFHDSSKNNKNESSSSSSHPNKNSAKNKSWIKGNKDLSNCIMESPDEKESSTSMISSSHPHKEESAPSISPSTDEKESSLSSLLKRSPSGKKKICPDIDEDVSLGDALLSSNIPLPPGTTISDVVVESNGRKKTGILVMPAGSVVDWRIRILRTRDFYRSQALRADPDWQREVKRYKATHAIIPL